MDRRPAKTRTALLGALTDLMSVQDWDEINVSAICERANTSRSTFYAHFNTKSDLLAFGFSVLEAQLGDEHPTRGLDRDGAFAFVPALLDHIRSHAHLFTLTASSVSQAGIFARFREVVDARSRTELRTSRRWRDLDADAVLFLNGGMFALIERWHSDGCRDPCEALMARIDRLTRVVLETFERARV